MKKLHSSQQGFGLIALILFLAVVIGISVVGYRIGVVKNHTVGTVSNIPAHAVTYPAVIKTKADLTKASNALQSSTIGSSLDPNQLSTDLQNLY